jgi:hypothetical protein
LVLEGSKLWRVNFEELGKIESGENASIYLQGNLKI